MKKTTYVCDRCCRESEDERFLKEFRHGCQRPEIEQKAEWCEQCIKSVLTHIQKKERYRGSGGIKSIAEENPSEPAS